MAFPTYGMISKFSSLQETWTAYVERLEQCLAANKLEDADQHRAILLNVCGPATYRLICSLVSPKKPLELKFKEITEVMQKHYDRSKAISYCAVISFQYPAPFPWKSMLLSFTISRIAVIWPSPE